MKSLILIATLAFSGLAQANATDFVNGYANATYNRYAAATQQARELDAVIQAFLAAPSEQGLEAAKAKWIEARNVYSVTEVYRFFNSPIDDEDGPEGLINAWPLDEAYIDSVIGNKNSGIINNPALFPVIDEVLLIDLNEKDGEANISTGWHAIEFLLWGQDISTTGPGARKYTDFVDAQNADRRSAYLGAVSQLLVKHLAEVEAEWNPANKSNFSATFVQDKDALKKVIEAAKFLAGEELAMERMFVAYDAQAQEDEHSCFSDTTHNDLYYNYLGIQAVLTEQYNGTSFISMVAAKDQALADDLLARLDSLNFRFQTFPAPFDQAIFDDESRVVIKSLIDDLRTLSDKVGEGLALVL